MQDRLVEALEKDYRVMCVNDDLEFDSDVFEEYLDLIFQDMADRYIELNYKRMKNDSDL
jgi:uncharacterized protein YjaG (DUF416 family)